MATVRRIAPEDRTVFNEAQIAASLRPGVPCHPDLVPDLDGLTLDFPETPEKDHAWGWLATYDDGSHLWEYEGGIWTHVFADIEKERVVRFRLFPFWEHLQVHTVVLNPQDGQRLIFFRRFAQDVNPQTGQQTGEVRQYTCVGWQRTVHGVNVPVYAFFLNDGRCLLTEDQNVVI